MKRYKHRILSSLLALVLSVFGIAHMLQAETARVIYRGEEPPFVIMPVGEDLFLNYKGMMPGDVKTQVVEIANESAYDIELFLHAEPVDPADEFFLNAFSLRVESSSATLFAASPAETTGLTSPVSLGILQASDTMNVVQLDLELTFPISAGNEYQSSSGIVTWVFTAEDRTPEPTPVPTTEPTPEPTTEPTPQPTIPVPTTGATPVPTQPPAPEPTPPPIPVPKTGEIVLNIGALLIMVALAMMTFAYIKRKSEEED